MPWMNMIRRCLSPWPIHLLIALASCPLRGAAALDALTSGFDIALTKTQICVLLQLLALGVDDLEKNY